MILIVGGVYQGKLTFAKKNFDIEENDIFDCTDKLHLEEKKCIYKVEELVKSMLQQGKSEKEIVAVFDNIDLENKIIVGTDIFQGIVPIDKNERVYREIAGRVMMNLSDRAEQVYRVFCGLAHRLK